MKWNSLVPELTVFEFERSLTFYQNVLEFTVRYERPSPRFAYLEKEEAQLMIEQWHEQGWYTAELAPPLGRGINLQLETRNVLGILDKLENAGTTLYRELKTVCYETSAGPSTQREFLVQDPDGYLLRFVEVSE